MRAESGPLNLFNNIFKSYQVFYVVHIKNQHLFGYFGELISRRH